MVHAPCRAQVYCNPYVNFENTVARYKEVRTDVDPPAAVFQRLKQQPQGVSPTFEIRLTTMERGLPWNASKLVVYYVGERERKERQKETGERRGGNGSRQNETDERRAHQLTNRLPSQVSNAAGTTRMVGVAGTHRRPHGEPPANRFCRRLPSLQIHYNLPHRSSRRC